MKCKILQRGILALAAGVRGVTRVVRAVNEHKKSIKRASKERAGRDDGRRER
jgi:hypothetical protein